MNTNDPGLRSFVPAAAESHFPVQNLPYGIFRRRSGGEAAVGVAIGGNVLDLAVLEEEGLLDSPLFRGQQVFRGETLNAFMALGPSAWHAVRSRISQLLRAEEPTLRDDARLRDRALVPMADVEMLLPAHIGDYTDFYSSREHATNVGSMFRGPDKALMPNWLHLPVAYHGRASSVVLSGTDLHTRQSGVADYAAENDAQAIGVAREIIANIGPEPPASGATMPPAAAIPCRPCWAAGKRWRA